jgi:hypothetical protein
MGIAMRLLLWIRNAQTVTLGCLILPAPLLCNLPMQAPFTEVGPWLNQEQMFIAAGCIAWAFESADVPSTHDANMRLLQSYAGREEQLLQVLHGRFLNNSDLAHLSALLQDWRAAASSL